MLITEFVCDPDDVRRVRASCIRQELTQMLTLVDFDCLACWLALPGSLPADSLANLQK